MVNSLGQTRPPTLQNRPPLEKMKRLKEAGVLVIISLFIAVIVYAEIVYAESDSKTITIHLRVIPVSAIEVSDNNIDMDIIDENSQMNSNPASGSTNQNNSSDMLVRTTVVEGKNYRELIPLAEAKEGR